MSGGVRLAIAVLVAVASVAIGRRLAAPSPRGTPTSSPGPELANGRADTTQPARADDARRRGALQRPLRRVRAWDAHVLRDPAATLRSAAPFSARC
jgi:hypothetical protein